MVSVVPRVLPRHVVAADSTVVSCGLTNFQRTLFPTCSTGRFGSSFSALGIVQDHHKFSESFMASHPQLRVGRTLFMIDCRPFRGNDETLRSHVGCHPQILRSVMDADGYGEVHRDLCQQLDWIMKGHKHFDHDLQEWPASIRC